MRVSTGWLTTLSSGRSLRLAFPEPSIAFPAPGQVSALVSFGL